MIVPVVEPVELMAKKKPTPPPPAPEPDQPSSETVRISTDLVEMLREICFHTKDARGRRLKIAQYVDNIFRPVVLREYAAFQARREGAGD